VAATSTTASVSDAATEKPVSDSGAGETAGEAQSGGNEAAGGSSSSTVLVDKEAAVKAAAEKVAATDKAIKEAAVAAAAEAKMARHTLYMALDASKGPEAIALFEAAKREAGQVTEEEKPQKPTLAATSRKRTAEPGILEQTRRRKIDRLTDLCDRLLERGVLVYDSTREQLAIEVRERRGEFEQKDAAKDEAGDATAAAESKQEATAGAATAKPTGQGDAAKADDAAASKEAATPAQNLIFVNKRFAPATSSSDDSGSGLLGLLSSDASAPTVDPEDKGSSAGMGQHLLWQYRWESAPDQIHGPFDSVTMHGWMTQACFSEERPAQVRQCDGSNSATEQCWHPMMEVNFSLYL
jgi:hypothetical protein